LVTVINELLKVARRFAPSRYSRLLKCMHSHASASVYKDCSNSECHRNSNCEPLRTHRMYA
jgi:hypothetical protein